MLDNEQIGVATNGVMYRTDKNGLLPALLRKWFDERVEYRKLSKNYTKKVIKKSQITLTEDNTYKKLC